MKPMRMRTAPNGEQITNAQNATSSVFSATPSTWIAGTLEVLASTDIGFMSPITLTPEDLYAWPVAIEFDIFGIGEGGDGTTAGTIRPQLWASTDLTKELPTYKTAAGVYSYPNSKTERQDASVTAFNMLSHIPTSGGVLTTFIPSATLRTAWHWNCKINFFSAQVTDDTYNAAGATMEWKQMTRSTLTINPNSGTYSTVSPGSTNTYAPNTGDANTTTVSTALSVSRIDCTNGIKIAPAISKNAFSAGYRLLVCSGIARCIPENNRIHTSIHSGFIGL